MRHGFVARPPDTSVQHEPAVDVDVKPDQVVAVGGELDISTASTLSGALLPLIERGGVIRVDLTHLVFIDASGIRAFRGAVQALGERGEIVVRDPSPRIRRVFDVAQLGHLVDVAANDSTTAAAG